MEAREILQISKKSHMKIPKINILGDFSKKSNKPALNLCGFAGKSQWSGKFLKRFENFHKFLKKLSKAALV